MDPIQISCPHCSTRLRVRDAISIGREVDCPECRSLLLIAPAAQGYSVTRVERQAPSDPASGKTRAAPSLESPKSAVGTKSDKSSRPGTAASKRRNRPKKPLPGPAARVLAFLLQPLVLAWIATGCVAFGGLTYVLFDRGRQPDVPGPGADRDTAAQVVPDLAESETDAEPIVAEPPGDPLERETIGRVEELHVALARHLESTGAFPAGTVLSPLPPEQRLSWQALLAEQRDSASPPVSWDHSWTDPANEAFVRRRLSEYQNPSIDTLTGADGFPATHFAGLAGVGGDAARLEAGHPRAGVFGDDRQTRLSQIPDGASQTWLLLGVAEHLGSWAAGGSPTVRGLTAEPYVNGPDGFGTGQSESMLVLLADGRVQVVSAQTDARVIRSLATIADGEPRVATESEAGDSPESAGEAQGLPIELGAPPDAVDESADQPIEPLIADEPAAPQRVIDIPLALAQPIASYEQTTARPLAELIPALSEMLGAPVRYDPADPATSTDVLKKKVQVQLKNTTVGAIMDGLLGQAGLAFRAESDHVRLVPRE